MRNGAHLPNQAITQNDLCRFRLGAFDAGKLMHFHSSLEVATLRVVRPDVYLMVRLPDTGQYSASVSECVGAWGNVIRHGLQVGIHDYQADNEPQLQDAWRGKPWLWRWFYEQVLLGVRATVPGQYRLGLAPLTYSPSLWDTLPEWRKMLVWRDPANPSHRSLSQLCEFACANAYWQSDRQMRDKGFGGTFMDVHELTGLPVSVTEWGCSLTDKIPRPTDEVIQAEMLRQYPEWLLWAGSFSYVESAFMFILGGTEQWRGFWPSDRVLRRL